MAYDKSGALASFCYQNGYTDTIQEIIDGELVISPNPETMEQFKERKFKEYYEQSVIAWEKNNAGKLAADSKEQEVREADVADDIKIEEVK